MNSCLKDKQLINSTMVRSLNDSEKGFIVSGQRLRRFGCCITTMLPVTLPSPWTNFFFAKKGISVVPQLPYSPDLSPCEFFLFPKLKFHLKGRHFGTVDNIQNVVKDQLRALPHEDFQHCYREWEQRLGRCVASQGNYEGHLESKERFAIKKYLLTIGKKKNMQVLSHTFTYFST